MSSETFCTKTKSGECYGKDGINRWKATVSTALGLQSLNLMEAISAVGRLPEDDPTKLTLIQDWESVRVNLCFGCPSKESI